MFMFLNYVQDIRTMRVEIYKDPESFMWLAKFITLFLSGAPGRGQFLTALKPSTNSFGLCPHDVKYAQYSLKFF